MSQLPFDVLGQDVPSTATTPAEKPVRERSATAFPFLDPHTPVAPPPGLSSHTPSPLLGPRGDPTYQTRGSRCVDRFQGVRRNLMPETCAWSGRAHSTAASTLPPFMPMPPSGNTFGDSPVHDFPMMEEELSQRSQELTSRVSQPQPRSNEREGSQEQEGGRRSASSALATEIQHLDVTPFSSQADQTQEISQGLFSASHEEPGERDRTMDHGDNDDNDDLGSEYGGDDKENEVLSTMELPQAQSGEQTRTTSAPAKARSQRRARSPTIHLHQVERYRKTWQDLISHGEALCLLQFCERFAALSSSARAREVNPDNMDKHQFKTLRKGLKALQRLIQSVRSETLRHRRRPQNSKSQKKRRAKRH